MACRILITAAMLVASAISPATAVELYGGDPIGMNPDRLELELCLAGARAGYLDKSKCDAQYEQRMQQKTPELLRSMVFDPKLLLLPPNVSDEERRHKEMMNGLQRIEDALRKR